MGCAIFANCGCQFCRYERDSRGLFTFGTLSVPSPPKTFLTPAMLSRPGIMKPFLLLENGKVFHRKSTAALKVLRCTSWVWPWMYCSFIIIPRSLQMPMVYLMLSPHGIAISRVDGQVGRVPCAYSGKEQARVCLGRSWLPNVASEMPCFRHGS